jgi:hypothetical protein
MTTTGKTRMISLRLTEEQYEWLNNTTTFIENETGCKASRASVVLRLMEKGLPHFQSEMEKMRAQANTKKKRFPRLQMAY